MYTFGDAWFLTALLLLDDWAPLRRILAAGDWLNHAIFTVREVNRAVSVLCAAGYIEQNGAQEFRTTEKAVPFQDAAFRKAGAFGKVDVVLAKLNRIGEGIPGVIVTHFSEEDITAAYHAYIRDLNSRR